MVENHEVSQKDINVKIVFVMIDGVGDLAYSSLGGTILDC